MLLVDIATMLESSQLKDARATFNLCPFGCQSTRSLFGPTVHLDAI